MRYVVQRKLIGITSIMAGIISAVGRFFIFIIRKPVASIRKPPQALKSSIITGEVIGKIIPAHKNKRKKIRNCGIAISDTTYPKLLAKIAAVKKSRIDFETRME